MAGFKSDKQRKGFFSNLRKNINNFNERRHDSLQKKLVEQTQREKVKLVQLQAQAVTVRKESALKQELITIKQKEKALRKEKFDSSNTGKFFNATKKGVSIAASKTGQITKRGVRNAVEFEKRHAKGQFKQLKKIFR